LFYQQAQVAADAEQPAARRQQDRPHVSPLAELGNAQAESAAKFTVNGISAVGLIEDNMREAIVHGAIKAIRHRRQVHRRFLLFVAAS
jgi:hypothetical protein